MQSSSFTHQKYGVKPIYLGSQFVSEAKIFGKELANILLNSKIDDNVPKDYNEILEQKIESKNSCVCSWW
jgi:hypothetical protein